MHDLFVAIERHGRNRNGIIYGVTGVSRARSAGLTFHCEYCNMRNAF